MSDDTVESIPSTVETLARRLTQVSERRTTSAFARIAFPTELDMSKPLFPLGLLSLYGHPIWDTLPESTRWRLGLLETVNFFSLNIHGEQALVAALVERLYRERSTGESTAVSRYLQHFIHEENSHTYMLAEFCCRYYGRVMSEAVFRFEVPTLSRKGADLLFFARVYVLETFLDFVNRRAMHDEALEPTARAVHRSHHIDETQHIAFDRSIITALAGEIRSGESHDELVKIGALVTRYGDYAFSRLVNPRLYRELSLPEPLRLVRDMERCGYRTDLKKQWWSQPQAFLRKAGVLTTDPRAEVP